MQVCIIKFGGLGTTLLLLSVDSTRDSGDYSDIMIKHKKTKNSIVERSTIQLRVSSRNQQEDGEQMPTSKASDHRMNSSAIIINNK